MRSEMKIGLIVGVLLAAGLIIFLVNQDNSDTIPAPDITLPGETSPDTDDLDNNVTDAAANTQLPVTPVQPAPVEPEPVSVQPELPEVAVDVPTEQPSPAE